MTTTKTLRIKKKLSNAASAAVEALTDPRDVVGRLWDAANPTIRLQKRIRGAVISGLEEDVANLENFAKTSPELMNRPLPWPKGRKRLNPVLLAAAGHTPLMFALRRGQVNCVDALIPLSDLEARSHNGDTALIVAASSRTYWAPWGAHGGPVARLLEAGACVDAQNKEGKTALMALVKTETMTGDVYLTELPALLSAAGAATVNTITHGRSALTEAMLAGAARAVAALLRLSTQAVRDQACEVALTALRDGFLLGMPFCRTSAGQSFPVSEEEKEIWWLMIALGDAFWSEETMRAAFELAGESAREKLPMSWARALARQEAEILRVEIRAAETVGATGEERDGAIDIDSNNKNPPRALSALRRARI